MTVALIILALLLAGTVPAAIAMGYKAGALRGDLTVSRDADKRSIKAAEDSEESATERIRRKDLVIAGLKAKLRVARDQLQTHPDPAVRGALALDSIVDLLSEIDNTDDDTDPGSDNKAGAMPPGVGS